MQNNDEEVSKPSLMMTPRVSMSLIRTKTQIILTLNLKTKKVSLKGRNFMKTHTRSPRKKLLKLQRLNLLEKRRSILLQE